MSFKYISKKLFGLLFAATLLQGLTGCKKWLEVNPATRVSEGEQFSSQQGYFDALFGTYQKMAELNAYGGLGTYRFIDVLAQYYENKSGQTNTFYGQTTRYAYTSDVNTQQNVRASISAIWSGYYGTIAQANYILKNVAQRNVLAGTALNIVKGEALAIRGAVHFDLLRMFAPAYLNGANDTAMAIPYMEQFTILPQARLSIGEVLTKCENDLKEAEQLLSVYPAIDQIAANQGATSAELLLAYRQNHINYWAAKAILARLYLFKGDKINALKYATEVINSGNFSFINPGTLSVDATTDASDLTFTPEHIFSLSVSNLKPAADQYFKSSQTAAADADDLFSTKAKLATMYEGTLPNYGTDIRSPDAARSIWNQLTTTIVYSKKYYSDRTNNVKQRLVPVVRLPEMYYIAAEAAPTVSTGVGYLNVVRLARLIPALSIDVVNTPALLDAELQKEYRKELYGEGQLWFWYKRKNVTTIPDGVGNPMTQAKYTFPLPLGEIEFGVN
ncbi:RagB/SusD family nutrient uptake outer membrane protein [Niabella sp. CJ426]|uniref:RagB/SusD family nutrient uptake outer membrane protein n=1 Tax=Niabella sp. CJ426 TaxID=3393740 RepID=UPI003D06037B